MLTNMQDHMMFSIPFTPEKYPSDMMMRAEILRLVLIELKEVRVITGRHFRLSEINFNNITNTGLVEVKFSCQIER